MMAFWCLLYIVWTIFLQLPYPVPLVGIPNANVGVSVVIAVLWFKIPLAWRKNAEYQKRARYMVLAHLFLLFLLLEYSFLGWVFYVIPIDFQWIMSIVLPVVRELGTVLLAKILHKIAGKKDSSGEIIAAHLGKYFVFDSLTLFSFLSNLLPYSFLVCSGRWTCHRHFSLCSCCTGAFF